MEVHDVGKFYKLLPKLGVQLEGFSRQGLEPHSLQQITSYLTELGSNPPIVTDATIEQGLPQLPSDYTLDMAPHDAEILHELSRMKNSAPGEDGTKVCHHWEKEFFANVCVTCGHHQHTLGHPLSTAHSGSGHTKNVAATSWETTAHYG